MSYILQLLKEIKTLNFLLNGRTVKYDQNGDSPVFYDVVFWRLEAQPAVFERIGTYNTYPKLTFTINNTLIGWDRAASVSSIQIQYILYYNSCIGNVLLLFIRYLLQIAQLNVQTDSEGKWTEIMHVVFGVRRVK